MLKKRKVKLSIWIVFVLTVCAMFPTTVFAQRVREGFRWSEKTNVSWNEKIDTELWEVMEEKSDDDLIPIWLWLKDINNETITKVMIEENGLDPAVYEDEKRFNEEIVPEITQQVEQSVGYEEAHKIVMPEQMNEEEKRLFKKTYNKIEILEEFNENDEAFFDRSISLVDRAISAKMQEYVVAKRGVVSREYSAVNSEFIRKNIGDKNRKILYNSRVTSTLVVEANNAEIEAYAKDETVERISFFVDYSLESEMDIVTQQIGADYTVGTKSGNFNNGAGYKGTGVRVGILEIDVYNENLPQFNSSHGVSLFKPIILGSSSWPGDHASMVTSIIAGQPTPSGSQMHEGIVPFATVFQVGVTNTSSLNLANTLQTLTLPPYNVNVVNISLGFGGGTLYSDYDQEFDRIIASTGVSVVKSAGNTSGNITSPGKALNIITTGNAQTKSSNANPSNPPYNLRDDSSFEEAHYLPNKPDIVAPGTYPVFGGLYPNKETWGTSWAAPMVVGVIAQMMQANPDLLFNPTAVKSKLLLAADDSKMTTINNPIESGSQHLRENSGAGFLDAINAVNTANSIGLDFVIDSNTEQRSQDYYFYAGQKVRAVMVYDKQHTNIIQSENDVDIIDFYIKRQNGNAVAMAVSNRNNVRIIEHQFNADGYYYFSASPYQLIMNAGVPGVNVHISLLTDSYSVTYDVNAEGDPTGGTVPIDNNLYASGETVNIKPGIPTREGYQFMGWTMNQDGTGPVYNNDVGEHQSFAMPEKNVRLYAKWGNKDEIGAFRFTIDTRMTDTLDTAPNHYSGASKTFQIPTMGYVGGNVGHLYSWEIDWGDGCVQVAKGASSFGIYNNGIPHTYENAGEYQITITPNGAASPGWLNAFGFADPSWPIDDANLQSNKNMFRSIDSPFTDTMRTAGASHRFANIFAGARNAVGIPADLFQYVEVSSGNTSNASYMFRNTFYGYAYNSTSMTIPAGLFSGIVPEYVPNTSYMFQYTFSYCAYNSTSATIPAYLFGGMMVYSTNNTGLFQGTFASYGYYSTEGTIPYPLFGYYGGFSGGMAYMFDRTFNNYAHYSTKGTIPSRLFAGVYNNSSGNDTSYMFNNTFNGYAYNSNGTIPELFSDYNIYSTNATGMFSGTFCDYAPGSSGNGGIYIPSALFSKINTTNATSTSYMFRDTFNVYAAGKSASIPSGLFSNISTASATNTSYMFANTFRNYGLFGSGIPAGLFNSINLRVATNTSYMFDGTFYGCAMYSGGNGIPSGLFATLNTASAANMSYMFRNTFREYARSSSSANIPAGLFGASGRTGVYITSNVTTNISNLFNGTFQDYGTVSSSGTIPSGLFSYIDPDSGNFYRTAIDMSYMFANTFNGYAYNSTAANLIPAKLFSGIGTIRASNVASMFYRTFYNYAYMSTYGAIPSGLFDFLWFESVANTTTNMANLFNGTFYNFAYSTSYASTAVADIFGSYAYQFAGKVTNANAGGTNGVFYQTFYNNRFLTNYAGQFISLKLSDVYPTERAYTFYGATNLYDYNSGTLGNWQ